MTKELWIDYDDKIISFKPIAHWFYQLFDSEAAILEKLDFFILRGFRFQ